MPDRPTQGWEEWERQLTEDSESLNTEKLREAIERAEAIALSCELDARKAQDGADHWWHVHRVRKAVLARREQPAPPTSESSGA